MKLSISVPDELWYKSQAARPGARPSKLVQEALEDLVETTEKEHGLVWFTGYVYENDDGTVSPARNI